MPIRSSPAIILRHLDYGEADRIVTFLTPEDGVKKGFARGARKSRKRFGAALEPFSQVEMHWSVRGGELVTLREAELLDLRAGLRSELSALALASYGVELTEELLGAQHGHPEAFELLVAFLDHLAAGGSAAETRLLFELRLLAMSGYIPHLLHCSLCNVTLRDGQAAFAAVRGGSLCPACAAGTQALTVACGTLGSLSRILQTPPTLFAGFRIGEQTLAEGGALLADALKLHLQRPLKSLAFLEQVAGKNAGG